MSMHLAITSGPDQGRTVPLSDGQKILIGRGQEATLQLSDPRASRKHCQVKADGPRVVVSDAGSSSGTFVNGRQVQEAELKPGDVIRVGDTELAFRVAAGHDQSTLVSAAELGARPKPAVAQDLSALIGQTIHKYRIERELAKGNTGAVFLARHTEQDTDVALKVLWPEISKNEEDMRRFVRAMKTMFPVRHENIVRIYNAGTTGEHAWVAMEYVDGESMAGVIERIGAAGMLDWQYAFRVAVHIGRALEAAQEHQIVHRNITPQNILLRTSDKVVKLGDLMLAKALAGSNVEQVTRPGQLVGELAYMSPERTGSGEIDGRSDLYGLGATCYALLTGRPPFEGRSLPELVLKIRNDQPRRPKEFQLSINDTFEGVVRRLLEKRPDDRYQTPAELLTDLDRIGRFQAIEV
ncbi:MAG TPA: FHA domain-containing serine/threonine-protein kinase [Planctomycetaceae bacterium]|nr:FHA domain-containing serine/threonine-protein kinase [Planctomycetaceae bacterium]